MLRDIMPKTYHRVGLAVTVVVSLFVCFGCAVKTQESAKIAAATAAVVGFVNYRNSPGGDKGGVVYFVSFPEGDVDKLIDRAKGRYPAPFKALKASAQRELRGRKYYDTETGLPCVTMKLRILTFSENEASIEVVWGETATAGGVLVYELRKGPRGWVVHKEKELAIS